MIYNQYPTYKDNNNLYKINVNDDLFSIQDPKENVAVPFEENSKTGSIVIVGSGESWKNLYNIQTTCDYDIMVINYNFKLYCDWLIYHDRRVGLDLMQVKFIDERKVIGPDNYSWNADYTYNPSKKKFKHTGAYAIEIAHQLGYKRIYLIGYDYCKCSNGKYHTYNNYEHFYNDEKIQLFLSDFDTIDYELYNLNPNSLLTKYEFKREIN